MPEVGGGTLGKRPRSAPEPRREIGEWDGAPGPKSHTRQTLP